MPEQSDRECQARQRLIHAKRIVVKVGTSTLVYPDGAADLENFERICRALANQMNQGKEMILVSSGAIAVGMKRLRMSDRPRTLPEKQAMAAIGQADLMNLYGRILSEYGHIAAQVLLTKDDVEEPKSRVNIQNTFNALLAKGVLPIVNENDTVSTRELPHNGTFGDNDNLSAIVAGICHADALVLFSDIDGLYDLNPQDEAARSRAKLISYVPEISTEIEHVAGASGTLGTTGADYSSGSAASNRSLGTGGMPAKIQAARIATEAGIDMVITQGHRPGDLAAILNGEKMGTFFEAKRK